MNGKAIDPFASLTDEQRAVVVHGGSHALVTAGAGSGKTATLLARIIYRLQKGCAPDRVLVLMFNRAAADGFRERLERMAQANGIASVPEVHTFHGFGARLAKAFVARGFLPDWKLESDNKVLNGLLRKAMLEANATLPRDDAFDPWADDTSSFLAMVDQIKGDLLETIESYKQREQTLFHAFERVRQSAGIRTFSDLICDPLVVIGTNPEATAFASNRYDELIADELQDVNHAQVRLLSVLAGRRAWVTGVGDPNQTLYGFRGANIRFMTEIFAQVFPSPTLFSLTRTFRFGPKVAKIANLVIANNKVRGSDAVQSSSDLDTAIHVRVAANANGHDQPVLALRDWLGDGRKASEAAILVRDWAASAPVEAALLRAGMPYQIVGERPFFLRDEVLSLGAYLSLAARELVDPRQEHREQTIRALFRVPAFYLPGRIIEQIIEQSGCDIREVPANLAEFSRMLAPDYRLASLQSRLATLTWACSVGRDVGARWFLGEVVKRTGIMEDLAKRSPRPEVCRNRQALVQEVLGFAGSDDKTVAGMIDWLREIGQGYEQDRPDSVLLTTVHRSKGLEWPLVVVANLADGAFPGVDREQPAVEAEIEDERRVFYVAVTRARERLVLCCPQDPLLSDRLGGRRVGEFARGPASRFLYESRLEDLVHRVKHGDNVVTPAGGTPVPLSEVAIASG